MRVPESPTSALSYLDNSVGPKVSTSYDTMNISNYYEKMCYAHAVKENKSEKIGLIVKRSAAWKAIYISGIKENGKFADSKLKVGMVILTINGIRCPSTVREIQMVMKECEGNLTIVAATISSEIDVTATGDGSSPVSSPTNTEEAPSSTKPLTSTATAGIDEDNDGPELIDDEEHPHNASMSSIAFDQLSTGPEIFEDDDHPDQPLKKSVDSDDGLEVSLTEHCKNTSPTNHDSIGSSTVFSAANSSAAFSPGSSPMPFSDRKVSESIQEYSPVRVSSIDHTGGIVITPKRSPTDDHQQQQQREVSAELEVPAMASRNAMRRTSGEDQDRTTKREARRSARVANVPAARPGAYPVSNRPSTRKSASSLSPIPRLAHTDDEAKRRALPPAGSARAPGAQRVPGMRQHRASAPVIRSLPSNALPPGVTLSPAMTVTGANNASSMAQRMDGLRNQIPPPAVAAHDYEIVDDRAPGAQQMTGAYEESHSVPGIPPHNPGAGRAASADDVLNSTHQAYYAPASSFGSLGGMGVGVGVGVPVPSGATSVVSSVSSCTFEGGHQTVDGDYSRRASADMSLAASRRESADLSLAASRRASADMSLPASSHMSVESGDALVVAAEVQEEPDIVADRIRQQILEETARADVVMVEHGGGASSDFDTSSRQEEMKKHKPKNVREKLFGDGKKGKDVSMDIEVSPDQYIRKRDLLPWTVKQNTTNDMWVAAVVTNQRAWEEDNHIDQERSRVIFSGKTEKEAKEAGLAMAAPILQSFEDNPICFMCTSKFAVFNRPHNCRNCGVVVCAKCSCLWSSKRLPTTYQTSKSTHSVCLACEWSANNFQDALMKGEHSKAVKLYDSGNVNLRSPFISSKKKSGDEVL